MKKLIFLLAPVLMTACVKSASDYDTPENPEKPWNEFDFTTSAVTSLSLDYAADAAVYFEIYDTAPVRENESGTAYEKVERIEPLYAVSRHKSSFRPTSTKPMSTPRTSMHKRCSPPKRKAEC